MAEKGAEAESVVARSRAYFAESYQELKKVQTPTRQETLRLSLVVLMIIVFVSICLFVMDQVFSWLMGKMIGS